MSSITSHTDDAGLRAGSFETLEGARRALGHLRDEGINDDGVAIVPRQSGTQSVRSRVRAGVPVGVLVGALLGFINGVALAFVTNVSPWSIALWTVGGVVVGLVSAGIVAGVDARGGRRSGTAGTERLAAGHYDLAVASQPVRARQVLARWWDPEARRWIRRAGPSG